MVIRSVQQIFTQGTIIWHKDWVPIENISPNMVYAAIASEDNKFVSHLGFDIPALQNAIEYNLENK